MNTEAPNPVKVSIVVSIYNGEATMRRTIDCLRSQTLDGIEIILVDDGSTDSTFAICEEYAALDTSIKVLHKENQGLGYARNSGIEIATGEYIAFFDSDDYPDENMYEKMYSFASQEGADACICGLRRVYPNGTAKEYKSGISGVFRAEDAIRKVYMNELGSLPDCGEDIIITWQSANIALYSTAIVEKYNLRFVSERELITEDHFFNIDFFQKATCVCVLEEALYNYCITAKSLTSAYRPDRFEQITKVYREQIKRVTDVPFSDDIIAESVLRIQRIYLSYARSCISNAIIAGSSYRASVPDIRNVCENPTLSEVLSEYPWQKNPLKHRVFNWGLSRKWPYYLYVMCKIRDLRDMRYHN